MRINADFSKRVVIRPEGYQWVHSPEAGVDRMMLDRIGEEVARATSLVKYAPGSDFPPHVHRGGEEFLVLEGVFSDEHHDYPAGTYVRNPIGTKHKPHSGPGCTILVKLHQFEHEDQHQKAIDMNNMDLAETPIDGISAALLHDTPSERVSLVKLAPGTPAFHHAHDGGEEVFVLEGVFNDEHGAYPKGTWLRMPHGSDHTTFSEQGCLLYVKSGHIGPDTDFSIRTAQ